MQTEAEIKDREFLIKVMLGIRERQDQLKSCYSYYEQFQDSIGEIQEYLTERTQCDGVDIMVYPSSYTIGNVVVKAKGQDNEIDCKILFVDKAIRELANEVNGPLTPSG